MNQEIAAPVIQQPKKRFCFAIIPFLLASLSGLFMCLYYATHLCDELNDDLIFKEIGYAMNIICYSFVFIGALFISVLLFTGKNNAFLAVPLFMISTGYLIHCGAFIPFSCAAFFSPYNYHYETFPDIFSEFFHQISVLFSISVAFLVVTVYIFIATSGKKPAPKVLWIIPAVLFCIFYAPCIIDLADVIISNYFHSYRETVIRLPYFISMLPYYMNDPLLLISVIFLLVWISFPYKNSKP